MTIFKEIALQYKRLQAQREANQISFDTFVQSVHQLRAQDASNQWWQIDPKTGQWMTWDGGSWVIANSTPVEEHINQATAAHCSNCNAPTLLDSRFCISCGHILDQPQTDKVSQDSELPHKTSGVKEKLLSYNQKAWDTISIMGGATMGALWFAYTKGEGADILTASTMAILPFLLVVLRPLLDRTLMPLQKVRQRIPKGFLLGLGLAVPFFVSNFLYSVVFKSSTSSNDNEYLFMFLTFIISVIVSYGIIRDPVSPRSSVTNQQEN